MNDVCETMLGFSNDGFCWVGYHDMRYGRGDITSCECVCVCVCVCACVCSCECVCAWCVRKGDVYLQTLFNGGPYNSFHRVVVLLASAVLRCSLH